MLEYADKSRVIQMAWEDRRPVEAIEKLYGLTEAQVISLMRQELKLKTFKNWRSPIINKIVMPVYNLYTH